MARLNSGASTMENFRVIAIALFLVTPILAIIALAVRHAGNSRLLNIVNYSKVADAASLHRWAGNRLAILPAASFTLGYAAFRISSFASISLGLFAVAAFIIGVWLAFGAERFQAPR
ncbi:hypothetical protein [Stenotrophomonas sp. YIM B06876]|uniref:hypothetical protein n=1 Tax=Stenotrophomonas sp. YIM B06876 TaxID=3060211 RepID=UPI002738C3F9|nr:hypothetical protein [Stenotrophomonas sp. YIM B06876]